MPINVLINGAWGRMGQEAVKAVQNDPELELVGQIGKTDDLTAVIQQSKAQVVVDLTTPAAVYKNTLAIINAQACPVIGTTGLTPEQIKKLEECCTQKKRGGVVAPNFSIAAILMMRFSAQVSQYFPHVEIIELHHAGKLDSPSGTAIKTAEMIATVRADQAAPKATHENIPGARGALHHHIPIHSIRLPGLVASQEVLFGGVGETLRICHNTIHREAFMPGILLACKKVLMLDHLVYGLEQLL